MMIDLKRAKKKAGNEVVERDDREVYPYGLRIRLENEELNKLDMGLPSTGTTVTLKVKCDVISVHENKRAMMAGEEHDRSVELQIIGMDMEPDSDD